MEPATPTPTRRHRSITPMSPTGFDAPTLAMRATAYASRNKLGRALRTLRSFALRLRAQPTPVTDAERDDRLESLDLLHDTALPILAATDGFKLHPQERATTIDVLCQCAQTVLESLEGMRPEETRDEGGRNGHGGDTEVGSPLEESHALPSLVEPSDGASESSAATPGLTPSTSADSLASSSVAEPSVTASTPGPVGGGTRPVSPNPLSPYSLWCVSMFPGADAEDVFGGRRTRDENDNRFESLPAAKMPDIATGFGGNRDRDD